MERSSILYAKFDCQVARQNISLLATAHDCETGFFTSFAIIVPKVSVVMKLKRPHENASVSSRGKAQAELANTKFLELKIPDSYPGSCRISTGAPESCSRADVITVRTQAPARALLSTTCPRCHCSAGFLPPLWHEHSSCNKVNLTEARIKAVFLCLVAVF